MPVLLAGAVYPRVGGGNRIGPHFAHFGIGLSPRGRGKPGIAGKIDVFPGSIPAWAGETPAVTVTVVGAKVYPRVGGGNPDNQIPQVGRAGLSPRGRGKLGAVITGPPCERSIPAWAGETATGTATGNTSMVYPRVGGGNPPPQPSALP